MSEEQNKEKELKEKLMNIKVTVDEKQVMDLMKQNEELKEQLEDYEEKLRLIAEKEFERKINQIQSYYNVVLTPEQVEKLRENPSSIGVLEQVLAENYKKQREVPSGVTPLSREQGYVTSQKEIPIEKREYYDYPSMIADIRTEQREDLLSKLFEKAIDSLKKTEKSCVFEEPKNAPSISEQLDEKFFFEHIAPKLMRAGMSEEEIMERYQNRRKKQPKTDLTFKAEPMEK